MFTIEEYYIFRDFPECVSVSNQWTVSQSKFYSFFKHEDSHRCCCC